MVYAVDISRSFTPAANFGSLDKLLNLFIPIATVAGGLLFLALLLWGAFIMITSAGDPERVKKAQSTLKYAIIGFVIVILAYTIVKLVAFVFNIQGPLPL